MTGGLLLGSLGDAPEALRHFIQGPPDARRTGSVWSIRPAPSMCRTVGSGELWFRGPSNLLGVSRHGASTPIGTIGAGFRAILRGHNQMLIHKRAVPKRRLHSISISIRKYSL